ncbi:zinc finger protein swm isoform X2 [Galleria mellonella]|uniref:Zinc finger protein swm isoform X2 n=1 Tax=Galleria mellonella TaxID=7137 RepID=A0ABM3MC06_GALME|nr:zinc finger protein swm isoform X2 [Galleria mellonella]
MIIENPDAFKSWLTSILEPLCDADPAALAKYVYALVKKDKPLDELRDGMLDQLDVFLQHETKPFVDMLFKSLDSHEYLKPVEKRPSPPPAAPDPDTEADTENHPPNGTTEENNANPSLNAGRPPRHRMVVTRMAAVPPATAAVTATANNNNNSNTNSAPAPAHFGAATRPPHHEQTLVKVLPLTELLKEPVDQPPRRRDRRGDSLREGEGRRRRRSVSWERRRARRHDERHDHVRRRPSRSPSPRGRYRNRSPPAAADRADRVDRLSRSRSKSPIRSRDHDRDRDRLRVMREMERDRVSRDRDHRDRLSRDRDRDRSRERSRERSRGSPSPRPEPRPDLIDPYKRRCRDFDEKGYCMRGDLCQWDHGSDPVVLQDVLAAPPPVPEYNPLTPDIWGGPAGAVGGFAPYPPHPLHMHPHPPRELIPIPRIRHEPAGAPPRMPTPKRTFDYNRLGAPRPPLPANAANCSLEVKKVPRGMNDITHLNNHFSKFGKIVNIQVCYENDPEAALITFSTPTEANIAYKSTEAVLNNRFIKVFWHNPENKQENAAGAGQQANKQPDRQNQQHPMSHNKVFINRENIKATADTKQQTEKQIKEVANGQEPKKEAPKSMEKFKTVSDMYQRARELLDKQLQQQKCLIERLESGNVTSQQKPALVEAINSGQQAIEKLNKEIGSYGKMLAQVKDETVARSLSRLQLSQANVKKPKTREEAQREILDAELDMFTKQQEGQDVTELVKKIADLRRQMAIQFPPLRRQQSRGGRFNTSTRFTRNAAAAPKVFSVNQSVDHRPRALLISGFEADELDGLVAHFSQYGPVCHKEVNLSVPELVLQFRARGHAEQAAIHGKHYNERTLSVTWMANPKPVSVVGDGEQRAPPHNGDNGNEDNKDAEASHEISEDALLRFDEEEEEDAEDRSWRR